MTALGIALIIGILVCIGAALGLYSTWLPGDTQQGSDTPGEDRASLVMALLLGLLLLWLVLGGRPYLSLAL